MAYDSLFTVEGITVDVTAENSVAARDEALAKAQRDAFTVLAKRMVAEGQVGEVSIPDDDTLNDFVRDFEVTNEKLSAIRYIGTYTFRFREKEISQYFSYSGVRFTNKSSKPLLIIPFFQIENKTVLWENNPWLSAWANADLSGGLVPVKVPIGDLMDVSDIDGPRGIRDVSPIRLNAMLERYNASEAVILIAMPDRPLAEAKENDIAPAGTLSVTVYRVDRTQPERVRDLVYDVDNDETRSDFFKRVVLGIHQLLQVDWKQKTAASILQTRTYEVRLAVVSIQEWVKIQRNLMGVVGLSDLEIKSMKPKEVHLTFKFRGDVVQLRDALSRNGLDMDLSGDPDFTRQKKPVYDVQKDSKVMYKPHSIGSGGFYTPPEPAAGDEQFIHTF
ncbi:MAG: DUF2066 domain-containing protein [Alphaproteobacteria bacterium]|nr:DUF2066 domain-containing protein [Alphaproteobacteria bacterium]